jgi:hypothetical protein
MTPDLLRLRENQAALMAVLERLELELVDDPAWGEPSDTSYLSPADRANPDIAANVAAMAATNKLVAWFGRDQEGFVGLWRGADGAQPLDASPVVRLDTEGQYTIVAATIPDYVAVSLPEDEFASTRDALTRVGFRVSNNVDAIWDSLDGFDDPNAYRNQLYEKEREDRGLARFEEAEPEPEPVAAPPPPAPAPKKAEKKPAPAPAKKAAAKKPAPKPAPKAKAKAKPVAKKKKKK